MQKINIEEQLDLLVKLQGFDAQIYRMRKEGTEKPELIKSLENQKIQVETAIKDIEEKIRAVQLKRKQREMDLQSKEESVKKLQAQLYQLKTNKEYQTMRHEIDGVKADNSLLEDEILSLMDEIDRLNREFAEKKEKFSEENRRIDTEKKKVEDDIKVTDEKISGLESERKKLAAGIDKEVLSHYERILVNRAGLALVAVKNYACQGCFINLPPQVINEIRMKDKLIVCESCARILYIEDESNI